MNELKIFQKDEFYKINDFQKEKPNPVMGIVYAVEYNKGFSKIGMSSIPAERVPTIKHYISDYMQFPVNRIMISQWHTNYKENEKKLHKMFSDCRLPNTELFSVGIDEISDFIKNGGIIFEDKSFEILDEIERGGNALVEFCKCVVSGEYDVKIKSKEMIEYENMLMSEGVLTKKVVEETKKIIDACEASLLFDVKCEISRIKGSFIEKWIKFGVIDEDDLRI